MFDLYEAIDPEFRVIIVDNGYVFHFHAKERADVLKGKCWSKERTFVFKNDAELLDAINAMKESF